MSKSLTVKVEPKVLRWLRERSGWNIEEASRKLKTSADTMRELESGEKSPTLRQLKDLSSAYKRPLASFFLSELEKEKPLPRDYRLLPHKKGTFDKKTIWAIRQSRKFQNIGLELSRNINSEIQLNTKKAKLKDKPDVVAATYRQQFDLSWGRQKKFRDSYEMFRYLRGALEDLNILVFQFVMPIEDARGFTLADESPPVIVVSSSDSIEARVFTLIHEFGHVLLGDTVIDIPESSRPVKDDVERWCDLFASSFLLPVKMAKNMFVDKRVHLTDTVTLNALSKKCKVSKVVILRKMLDLYYISEYQYKNTLARYTSKKQNGKSKSDKKIPRSPDQMCISEMGGRFVSLVADNFDSNFITYTDALGYLSIKASSIEKVLTKARK